MQDALPSPIHVWQGCGSGPHVQTARAREPCTPTQRVTRKGPRLTKRALPMRCLGHLSWKFDVLGDPGQNHACLTHLKLTQAGSRATDTFDLTRLAEIGAIAKVRTRRSKNPFLSR